MGWYAPNEIKIMKSMRKEREEYYEKFGEYFPSFNHDQWFGKDGKAAIQIWHDELLKALETGKPYVWIPEEHTIDWSKIQIE